MKEISSCRRGEIGKLQQSFCRNEGQQIRWLSANSKVVIGGFFDDWRKESKASLRDIEDFRICKLGVSCEVCNR